MISVVLSVALEINEVERMLLNVEVPEVNVLASVGTVECIAESAESGFDRDRSSGRNGITESVSLAAF